MNKRTVVVGASVLLLLICMPAQAGLGDLLGPILNPPSESGGGVLGELVSQVVAPVTETVETVVAPVTEILIETVETTTETVIVPIVGVVGETVETTIDTVDETTEILIGETVEESPPIETPSIETPPIVIIDGSDLPGTNPPLVPVPIEPDIGQLPSQPATSAPSLAITPQAVAGDPVPTGAVVRALLTTLTAPAQIQSEPVQADPSLPAANPIDSGWLFSLSHWLGVGVSGLLDVLSIPMRLLEILIRALTSSAAGLLAPASLLLTLGAGSRRRWFTVA